jgi:hypothetical protein
MENSFENSQIGKAMHYIELTTTKFARKILLTIKQTKLKMYGKFASSQFY